VCVNFAFEKKKKKVHLSLSGPTVVMSVKKKIIKEYGPEKSAGVPKLVD
jgi:hypothetical protein